MLNTLVRAHRRHVPFPVAFSVLIAALATGCSELDVKAALVMPTVAITASPATIALGGSSILTVKAVNAMELTVKGSDGSSYHLAPGGGTLSVKPSETTTYSATASGTAGAKSVTTVVHVGPASTPAVRLTADPEVIDAGRASNLTVTSTGADSLTLAGSDGSEYKLPAKGGTQEVRP